MFKLDIVTYSQLYDYLDKNVLLKVSTWLSQRLQYTACPPNHDRKNEKCSL